MRERLTPVPRRAGWPVLCALLLVQVACAGRTPENGGRPVNFVQASDRIDTAGQPGRAWLQSAGAAGYRTVISLTPPGSDGTVADEKEILAAAGVEYVNIPVDWSDPGDDDFDRFRAALAASAPGRALVHCQLNMRASAFTFLYRVIEEDADPEDAWTRVTDVWFPEGRWRRFIEATLQRHGEAFRP
jgi:uncharacterized protein (TIGR01244 family)